MAMAKILVFVFISHSVGSTLVAGLCMSAARWMHLININNDVTFKQIE